MARADAASPDVILGRRARTDASSMEAFLAMPGSGEPTGIERDILPGAQTYAVWGNPDTARLIST